MVPKSGPKPDATKPKMSGAVPTNRRARIPSHSGPISACLDDDPKLLNEFRVILARFRMILARFGMLIRNLFKL